MSLKIKTLISLLFFLTASTCSATMIATGDLKFIRDPVTGSTNIVIYDGDSNNYTLSFPDLTTDKVFTFPLGEFQPSDDDLTDLAEDGSLTGAKVGFSDSDSKFSSDNIDAAMSELNNFINGGVPNSVTAKVNWSQLVDVPAGFADGSDATGTGGDQEVDIVTTAPLFIDGGANKDNVLPGTDGDVTFSIPAATNIAPGHMTAVSMATLENNAKNKYSLTISGDGSAITAGVKYDAFFFIPRDLTLTGIALTTDEQVGSCTVDIWAGALGGTTGFLNITDSNSLFNVATPPSIADASSDNTVGVSSFDTDEEDVTQSTVIGINVDACVSLTRICIIFYFE